MAWQLELYIESGQLMYKKTKCIIIAIGVLFWAIAIVFSFNPNVVAVHGDAYLCAARLYDTEDIDAGKEAISECSTIEMSLDDVNTGHGGQYSANVGNSNLFGREYLYSLTVHELNELYAPFRAVVEAIDSVYGLTAGIVDAHCLEWGREAVINTLETYTLEDFEQGLKELANFFLVIRLSNHMRWLVHNEYEIGEICQVKLIELDGLIARNDISLTNLVQILETLPIHLQLVHPCSVELLHEIESIMILLQDFCGMENRFMQNY